MQVAKVAAAQDDGLGKPSMLAATPAETGPGATVAATKSLSAADRARKRQKKASAGVATAVNPMALLEAAGTCVE